MAGVAGELPGGASGSAGGSVEVEPEVDEVLHPRRQAALGCDCEFVVQELLGSGEMRAELSIPRPVRGGSESEADEELEMCGIVVRGAGETVVVEGLAVVRVGSRFQQRECELRGVRVRGLIGFTSTERSGECGEWWNETSPQESGVRICARVEQQRCGCQRRASVVVEIEP